MIGPLLAVGILSLALATLIPWIVRSRREDREIEQRIRCGAGCICGGENVRQQKTGNNITSFQAPAPLIIHARQPQPVHYPQQQPVIVVLQQPAPQPVYQQQPQVVYVQPPPQQPQYLPAPTYQPNETRGNRMNHPNSSAYAPQSYYPGYSPSPDPQEVYRLPPQQPVGQLPPPKASDIAEATRRKWERECEEVRRR